MYKDQLIWQEREALLPEEYRINQENEPLERFIYRKNWKIHLDHYKNPNGKAKIILLHGVGGNGRVLSFIAVPLHRAGFELIVPDLPGYGYSEGNKKKVTYTDWVDLASHLIDREKSKDDRPLFVFGWFWPRNS